MLRAIYILVGCILAVPCCATVFELVALVSRNALVADIAEAVGGLCGIAVGVIVGNTVWKQRRERAPDNLKSSSVLPWIVVPAIVFGVGQLVYGKVTSEVDTPPSDAELQSHFVQHIATFVAIGNGIDGRSKPPSGQLANLERQTGVRESDDLAERGFSRSLEFWSYYNYAFIAKGYVYSRKSPKSFVDYSHNGQRSYTYRPLSNNWYIYYSYVPDGS